MSPILFFLADRSVDADFLARRQDTQHRPVNLVELVNPCTITNIAAAERQGFRNVSHGSCSSGLESLFRIRSIAGCQIRRILTNMPIMYGSQ